MVFAGTLVLLCFAYAPALTQRFLITDDYMVLSEAVEHPELHSFQPDFQLGRWVSAYFTDWLVFQWMGTVANAWIMRLVALVAMSGLGTLIYLWLRRLVAWPIAVALPVLMLLSMPFQIISAWVCMMGTLFGLLASTVAAMIFHRLLGFEGRVPLKRVLLAILLIAPLLIFAMGLYESYGMFYWTMLAIYLLARPEAAAPSRWPSLFVYGIAGGVASWCTSRSSAHRPTSSAQSCTGARRRSNRSSTSRNAFTGLALRCRIAC